MVTIDKQVAGSTYDGYWRIGSSPAFSNADEYQAIGKTANSRANLFARWYGITIPTGAIITTAYIQFRIHSYAGTPPECKLYFNDAQPVSAPTTYNGADAKVRTTAYVNYTPPTEGDWVNSPEIKTIIQELVDSYTYDSGSMMLLGIGVDGDETNDYTAFRTYNYATGDAPKLHIEYTMGSLLPRRRSFNSILVR